MKRIVLAVLIIALLSLAICVGVVPPAPMGPPVTYVVAASDAPVRVKAVVDYACDGTDDQVEIQAAIDALPARGGVVVMVGETFYKSNTAPIRIPSNIALVLGGTVTFVPYVGDGAVVFANADEVDGNSNIRIIGGIIDGNKANQTGEQSAIRLTKVTDSQVVTLMRNFRGWYIKEVEPGPCNQFVNLQYPNMVWVHQGEKAKFEQSPPGSTILDSFEEGWEIVDRTGTPTFRYDTSDFTHGNCSLKATLKQGEILTVRKDIPPTDISGAVLQISHKVDDVEKIQGYTYLNKLRFGSGVSDYIELRSPAEERVSNEWFTFTLPPDGRLGRANYFTQVGTPDLEAINFIQIQVGARPGFEGTVNIWLDELSFYHPSLPNGLLSICFDDGYEEDFLEAFPILSKYGYPASHYVPLIYPYQGTEGRLTEEQLITLSKAGHDISPHAWTHTRLDSLSPAEVEDEVGQAQEYLSTLGLTKAMDIMVPPGHKIDSRSYRILKRHFTAVSLVRRSWVSDLVGAMPVFSGLYDPTVQEAKDYIDAISEWGMWGRLNFHRVVDGGAPYTISPADFAEIVDYIHQKGVPVVTVSDVIHHHAPALYADETPR